MKKDGMGSHHGICLEQSLTVSRPALEDFIVDLSYNFLASDYKICVLSCQ